MGVERRPGREARRSSPGSRLDGKVKADHLVLAVQPSLFGSFGQFHAARCSGEITRRLSLAGSELRSVCA